MLMTAGLLHLWQAGYVAPGWQAVDLRDRSLMPLLRKAERHGWVDIARPRRPDLFPGVALARLTRAGISMLELLSERGAMRGRPRRKVAMPADATEGAR